MFALSSFGYLKTLVKLVDSVDKIAAEPLGNTLTLQHESCWRCDVLFQYQRVCVGGSLAKPRNL